MIVKERAIVSSEPASRHQHIWLEIETDLIVVKAQIVVNGQPHRYDCALSKADVRQLIDALSNYMVSGQFTVPRPLRKFMGIVIDT